MIIKMDVEFEISEDLSAGRWCLCKSDPEEDYDSQYFLDDDPPDPE